MQGTAPTDNPPEILATLPRHPQDDKIAYCPDDPSVYVPLVQKGFLRAAIVPCANRDEFNRAAKITLVKYLENKKDIPPFLAENIQRCSDALAFRTKLGNGTEILASPENSGRQGSYPAFHTDYETAYISLYGAKLEFITGDLKSKTLKMLRDFAEKSAEEIVENISELRSRIHTLEHGDLIYFEGHFHHRSSFEIPKMGQLAITCYNF